MVDSVCSVTTVFVVTFDENLCGVCFKTSNSVKLMFFEKMSLHDGKSKTPVLYLPII